MMVYGVLHGNTKVVASYFVFNDHVSDIMIINLLVTGWAGRQLIMFHGSCFPTSMWLSSHSWINRWDVMAQSGHLDSGSSCSDGLFLFIFLQHYWPRQRNLHCIRRESGLK